MGNFYHFKGDANDIEMEVYDNKSSYKLSAIRKLMKELEENGELENQ